MEDTTEAGEAEEMEEEVIEEGEEEEEIQVEGWKVMEVAPRWFFA